MLTSHNSMMLDLQTTADSDHCMPILLQSVVCRVYNIQHQSLRLCHTINKKQHIFQTEHFSNSADDVIYISRCLMAW